MATISLNSSVHLIKTSGTRTTKTVRDIMALASGTTYDCLQMMDEWGELKAAYDAETLQPLESIREQVKKARKAWALARYWWTKGVYEFGGSSDTFGGSGGSGAAGPSDTDLDQAREEFNKTWATLIRLENKQFMLADQDLYAEQEDRACRIFASAAPPVSMPEGLQTVMIRGFTMPVPPWSPAQTVTVACNQIAENHRNPVLNYPKGTVMRVFHMVPDVETMFSCEATVVEHGCLQTSPRTATFPSTCDWLMSLPYLYLARISITLPTD
jgi:hypothetical protein